MEFQTNHLMCLPGTPDGTPYYNHLITQLPQLFVLVLTLNTSAILHNSPALITPSPVVMEEHHLRRHLLSTPITDNTLDDKILSLTPTSCIVQRVLLVIFIGLISVWANNEASKGFEIRVINDMKATRLGRKFSLFFVANDEATRLVQAATASVTRMLYSDTSSMTEKVIDQVDVQLAGHNLTHDYLVVTKTPGKKNRYVILISPFVMESADFKYRFRKAIQRGMAEVLLFDKRNLAPKTLIDGLVEYISNQEGLDGSTPELRSRNFSDKCWEDKDPKLVAQFLRYCERRSEGFIRKLYQAIGKDDWGDNEVDKALGLTATHLCETLHSPLLKNDDSVPAVSISTYR